MNSATIDLGERLTEIREQFDAKFATPRTVAARDTTRLVSFLAGGERVSVRLQDIAGVVRPGRIVRAPGATNALLGFTGVRGSIVAAFSLARLLGFHGGADERRWLIRTAADPTIGLVVDGFEGFHEIDSVAPRPSGDASNDHFREVVCLDGHARFVLAFDVVLSLISHATQSTKHGAISS